jgi:3'-phosphoadenosine 5'-phosphosulfate sulfotransferase (PAPS reductase)/FAD synthetase
MTTQQLINNSLVLIRETLGRVKNPVIAWSGGKDSQVMLHLIRHVRRDIPVLHLRGFEHEIKHDFAEDEIGRLGLHMVEPEPIATDAVAQGSHVEVVEEYRLTDRAALYFPIEPDPAHVPGPNSLCAVEKLNQPAAGDPLGVDCIFIGHRSDDVDPVHGAILLERDAIESDGVLFVYPLKDWTEANIWEASELLNIPQNQARYKRQEMNANADYFPMCVECLKPTDAESVVCPKIGEPVYAIGRDLNLEQRREEWRNKFVNLREA